MLFRNYFLDLIRIFAFTLTGDLRCLFNSNKITTKIKIKTITLIANIQIQASEKGSSFSPILNHSLALAMLF